MVKGIVREARISDSGRYRYTLMRRWGQKPGGIAWVMLNPSVADADIDDPTIRRCMGFSQREGFDAMVVVNLCALRATDPSELLVADDPGGPENGKWLHKACHQAPIVVCAWGAVAKQIRKFADFAVGLMQKDGYGEKLRCLGKTQDGSPRHPLYVRSDAPLVEFA